MFKEIPLEELENGSFAFVEPNFEEEIEIFDKPAIELAKTVTKILRESKKIKQKKAKRQGKKAIEPCVEVVSLMFRNFFNKEGLLKV